MISRSGPLSKLKTNLKLSIQRLKLLAKKKVESTLKARPEIANYIQSGKVDRARIRVEHIIREDYIVEAYEILEMYCDLLLARISLIEQKKLDDGLIEPVSSLIWAAPRLGDCLELKVVADLLAKKYGKEFALSAKENSLQRVNEKLVQKLSIEAPPKILVERYLVEIAKSQNVPYTPDPNVMNNSKGGGGGGGSSEKPLIGFLDPPPLPATAPSHPGSSIGFRSDLFDVGVDPLDLPASGSNQPYPDLPHPKSMQPPMLPSNAPVKPVTPPPSYPGNILDDLPAVPTSMPPLPDNSPDENKKNGDEEEIDFDALTKRFEALKKIK